MRKHIEETMKAAESYKIIDKYKKRPSSEFTDLELKELRKALFDLKEYAIYLEGEGFYGLLHEVNEIDLVQASLT